MDERLGIVGSGTIACGLAATAAQHGEVVLWARSEASAKRARARVDRSCGNFEPQADSDRVTVVDDLDGLAEASFVVEAIVEEHDAKTAVLRQLGRDGHRDSVLATTTSALSIAELARASGRPERFVGFHVFNPVPRMELVELAFPAEADEATRARARGLCEALGKTPVEVPDVAGFVVNRLLFPFLFDAVELLDRTGMAPDQVDACMKLGAGHPTGPLALLDYVGLDVAVAIGEAIEAPIPARLRELVAEGALGRKAGRGLYSYE